MPPSPEAGAGTVPLVAPGCPAFLHALWGQAAQVDALPVSPGSQGLAARAVLGTDAASQRILQLPTPPGSDMPRRWQAATAHAAAHWRFGGEPQPRAGLKPVQQALLGVLEDARVEWLALQELPGLRALWLPFHQGAEGPQGAHAEALLARLSHSLLDPAHHDPHPWIARARAAFFTSGGTLALHGMAEVRRAASVLGHDIGQMRLPFNAPTYRVHARYRDDNHHLWQYDPELPPSDTPLAAGAGGGAPSAPADGPAIPVEPVPGAERSAAAGAAGGTSVAYAEWDHRIGRYRPAWSQVFDRDMPPGPPEPAAAVPGEGLVAAPQVHVLARALVQMHGATPRSAGRASGGEEFHAAALVDAAVQQRLRQVPDARVYRRRCYPSVPLAVVVLLDASASTAEAAAGGGTLLQALSGAAWTVAAALEAAGHRATLLAFASYGRARVELSRIKGWAEPARSPQVRARLHALQSAGSTRFGTVLRHATALASGLQAAPGVHRRVLLLTDGQAHDVDVFDPAYLAADQQHAVAEAARRGVGVACLVADGVAGGARVKAATRASGAARSARFSHAGDLPRLVPALLRG